MVRCILACSFILFPFLASGGDIRQSPDVLRQPRIVCAEPNYGFGRVVGTNQVAHVFKIANDGNAPLIITRIHAACGCTEVEIVSDTIAAHEATDLSVKFNTAGRVGPQRKSIYIHSNDPLNPILCLMLNGDIVAPTVSTNTAVVGS